MEETEPEEGAVELTKHEENGRHSSYSWDLPKSWSGPNPEENSSLLPCANQNECHEHVKHPLYLLVPLAYEHLGQQQLCQAINSALMHCCAAHLKGRMVVGGGKECQKSHRMDVIVGIMVGAPLGPLFSCMKRMPKRLRNRFWVVRCNPEDPALWAGVGVY